MPEPETIALDLTCSECGRSPRAGETWRILFADKVAREAFILCPECAERESAVTSTHLVVETAHRGETPQMIG